MFGLAGTSIIYSNGALAAPYSYPEMGCSLDLFDYRRYLRDLGLLRIGNETGRLRTLSIGVDSCVGCQSCLS